MAAVKDLSTEDLRSLISEVVEEKLVEWLGDPDEGLSVRPAVRDRLLNRLRRGTDDCIPADEVARRLGLEW